MLIQYSPFLIRSKLSGIPCNIVLSRVRPFSFWLTKRVLHVRERSCVTAHARVAIKTVIYLPEYPVGGRRGRRYRRLRRRF
ncbi:hypothetical protein PUN28_001321 [Cardiocondyla obscurior]|uniref:Uncharacterized protein n=1 Tax=Cardiocondyla obscurior TaxID=286306 RepID=A0AAW2H4R4_9HYME